MARYKARCAVCGRNIEKAVRQSHGDEEYHFCSEICRVEFLKDPEKYERVWRIFRKHGFERNAIKCAVCGELVSEEVATRQEYHEESYSNEKYYFCCENHRLEFIADPETYKGMPGKHLSQ